MKSAMKLAVGLSLALLMSFGAGGVAAAQSFPDHCEQVSESSGFVDDEGCPISLEDWREIRDSETGMQWDNIAILVGVLGVLIAGVVVWRKKRSGVGPDTGPDPA